MRASDLLLLYQEKLREDISLATGIINNYCMLILSHNYLASNSPITLAGTTTLAPKIQSCDKMVIDFDLYKIYLILSTYINTCESVLSAYEKSL